MNIILFESIPEGNLIPASDERAQHIIKVLGLKPGDSFRMGVVNESEGNATVKSIDGNGVEFEYQPQSRPSLYPVTLLCAQVRPICMKRILREAVCLGVERIILCGSDTGEKSYLKSSIYTSGEYRSYLLDGAMQSAHAGVSEVLFADTADQAIRLVSETCPDTDLIFMDNVTGAVPLSTHDVVKERAVLAIGPERGWSARERRLFTDAGYAPMLLGSRVLRTETACPTGIAVLLGRMGLL